MIPYPRKTQTPELTCRPCRARYAGLGGHLAGRSYRVGTRLRLDGGHFLYRPPLIHAELDAYAIPLCRAARIDASQMSEEDQEIMSIGPLDVHYTYEVVVGEDGAEISGSMNPVGSWLVHEDAGAWAVQPSGSDENDPRAAIFNTIGEAVAYSLAEMVKAAMSGNEYGDEPDDR